MDFDLGHDLFIFLHTLSIYFIVNTFAFLSNNNKEIHNTDWFYKKTPRFCFLPIARSQRHSVEKHEF